MAAIISILGTICLVILWVVWRLLAAIFSSGIGPGVTAILGAILGGVLGSGLGIAGLGTAIAGTIPGVIVGGLLGFFVCAHSVNKTKYKY